MKTSLQAFSVGTVFFGVPAIAGGADHRNITLPVACITIACVLGAVCLILWLATPRDKQKVIGGVVYRRKDCFLRDGFTEEEFDRAWCAGVHTCYVGKHLYIAEDEFIRHIFIKEGKENAKD